jgi:hypothetical protein
MGRPSTEEWSSIRVRMEQPAVKVKLLPEDKVYAGRVVRSNAHYGVIEFSCHCRCGLPHQVKYALETIAEVLNDNDFLFIRSEI